MEKLLEVACRVYVARPEVEAKNAKKEKKCSIVLLAQALQKGTLGNGGGEEVLITEQLGKVVLSGIR